MKRKLVDIFLERKQAGIKSVAVLLDPDDIDFVKLPGIVNKCEACNIHYLFVGGSLINSENFIELLSQLKTLTKLPVIIFPGNNTHIFPEADGILLLSLVSGRNPEFLIGQHVIAAPVLKRSGLEVLSTAYILVDGGSQTTVSYISNTNPIPNNKPDIAVATAIAAEMIGMKLTYLDAGSGADSPVSTRIIKAVAENVETPVIVGGGLSSVENVEAAFQHGADVVVVGNAIEENSDFILELSSLTKVTNAS
jgi:putative glycerol-1-phosphate prenyltransferase